MIKFAVQTNAYSEQILRETCRSLDVRGLSYFKFTIEEKRLNLSEKEWAPGDIVVPLGDKRLHSLRLPLEWKLFYDQERFDPRLSGFFENCSKESVALMYRIAIVRFKPVSGCKCTDSGVERLTTVELDNQRSLIEYLSDAYLPHYTYIIDLVKTFDEVTRKISVYVRNYHCLNTVDLLALDRGEVFNKISESEIWLSHQNIRKPENEWKPL